MVVLTSNYSYVTGKLAASPCHFLEARTGYQERSPAFENSDPVPATDLVRAKAHRAGDDQSGPFLLETKWLLRGASEQRNWREWEDDLRERWDKSGGLDGTSAWKGEAVQRDGRTARQIEAAPGNSDYG
jgi:hypothetical protein